MDNYDRHRIVLWMMANCQGFRNITPRQEIVKALGIDDRRFRKLCSSIPEIVSNSRIKHISIGWNSTITVKVGYYCLPLVINQDNILEAKVARILLNERKSRAGKLWDKVKKTEQLLDERVGKQRVFA